MYVYMSSQSWIDPVKFFRGVDIQLKYTKVLDFFQLINLYICVQTCVLAIYVIGYPPSIQYKVTIFTCHSWIDPVKIFQRVDIQHLKYTCTCTLYFSIHRYIGISTLYIGYQLSTACIQYWVMVFNTTFNNISVISWRLVIQYWYTK